MSRARVWCGVVWCGARAEVRKAIVDGDGVDTAGADSLHVVDSALFVLCLDHYSPHTLSELSRTILHGTSDVQGGLQGAWCGTAAHAGVCLGAGVRPGEHGVLFWRMWERANETSVGCGCCGLVQAEPVPTVGTTSHCRYGLRVQLVPGPGCGCGAAVCSQCRLVCGGCLPCVTLSEQRVCVLGRFCVLALTRASDHCV